MEILGYLSAVLIGVSLGLIGGGGSILTVPVLVYFLSVSPVLSTSYSLFVVGVSALVGALRNIPKGLVDFRTGIVFAVPAFIAVYVARKYILPAIPESLFFIGDFEVTKDIAIMMFFAILMMIAAFSMIRKRSDKNVSSETVQFNYPLVIIEGLAVGLVTGIVGAGGGFLIIPALVLLAKLPMKQAVATSLLIIAAKSLIGFIGDIETMEIAWSFLLPFTALSVVGIFVGVWLQKFINGNRLKTGFGWFVLLMGVYIFVKEMMLF